MTPFPLRRVQLRIAVAGLLLFAGLLTSCGENAGPDPGASGTPAGERLRVVATTVQISALTKEVAGDKIALTGLVPAGADPHAFEPKPSDLVAIEEAQLILRHGIGLDEWLDDTLEAGNEATSVTVTDGLELAQGDDDGEQVEDPHVWHDPENAKTMIDDIADALAAADPENASTYEANASAYKATLDEAAAEVQSIIDEIPAADRKMVTDHDAFEYFADAFGLKIVGAIFPVLSTEGEPSAQETAALLETIEREGVKAIFAEESANPRLATTLAEDAGVTIVDDLYGDSLGEPGSDAETVDGMLLANARRIADALK